MNYYEELGIRPDADEEEIRKAHRRLVKLMHPDQHRDQGMKQLAETQMRRLNSIVATLLDPEEREEYDEQLKGVDLAHAAAPQSTWRSVPWWIASTLGAIVLTVAAVYFFADHIGSGFKQNPNPPEITGSEGPAKEPTQTVPFDHPKAPAPAETKTPVSAPPISQQPPAVPEASRPVEKTTTTVAVHNDPKPPEPKTEAPKPQVSKPEVKERPAAPAQTAKVSPAPGTRMPILPSARTPETKVPAVKSPDAKAAVTGSRPPTSQPPPSQAASKTIVPQPKQPPSVIAQQPKSFQGVPPALVKPTDSSVVLDARLRPPTVAPGSGVEGDYGTIGNNSIVKPPPFRPHDPLEGEWVYAPVEPEKGKPGFFPPEFIQLKLRKESDGMRGEYNARYNVVDKRPITPTVNFVLKSVDKSSLKYVWSSADGRNGTFTITSLEPDTMRLEWKQTSGKGGPALTNGVATLVRKN